MVSSSTLLQPDIQRVSFCPGAPDRSPTQPAQGNNQKEHSLPLPAPGVNSLTTTKTPQAKSFHHKKSLTGKREAISPVPEEQNCISDG